MSFTVIYDACVLYPAPLRDLLIRVANTGLVRARWSADILDECFRNILKNRPDLTDMQLRRTRNLMNDAIEDVEVSGYKPLIDSVILPDPNDRHVVAAAIKAGAQAIVTFNRKDFPQPALQAFDMEALSPDDFALDLLDLKRSCVEEVIRSQAAALRSPPTTYENLLDTLEKQGLRKTIAALRNG